MANVSMASLHLNDGTQGLPKNPRCIRDARFAALCDSIRDNPEFMPARPIIVDEADTILGGNMRFRACQHLGMKEIPAAWVVRVTGWPIEKKRRFIILDNRGFGEDDMDMLANEWEIPELIAAGMTDFDLGKISGNPNDPEKEWDGMPACDQQDKTGIKITVHCETETDVESFEKLIGQKVQRATMSLWHPYKAHERHPVE